MKKTKYYYVKIQVTKHQTQKKITEVLQEQQIN